MRCVHKLLSYLKYRWTLIALWLLTLGVLFGLSALNGLDRSYVRYAALLVSFFFLLLMLISATPYFRRRRLLRRMTEAGERLVSALPEPGNALERDYQALIQGLIAEQAEMRRQLTGAQNEQLSYYTLWVHQIKTPIAAMQLVLGGADDERSRTLARELFKIEQYADLALRYAKMTDMSADLVIERFPLEPVVREAVKKFALLFVHQRLSVSVKLPELTVTSDRRWLLFIIEQLLSNAVKYTKAGGVRIFARMGALVIEDTGIGIRPEDLPRIFERGYTGYNGRLDARASGVGLYLARRAADALGVRIEASSTLGRGTAMTLRFPEEHEILE